MKHLNLENIAMIFTVTIRERLLPFIKHKISNKNHWETDPEDPRPAQDVIYSFFVPEFRLYQDCVLGRTVGWVWFQATRTGIFQLACKQLCGTGHYDMKAPIRIVPKEESQKWLLPRRQKNAGTSPATPSMPLADPPNGNLTSGINNSKL